jgi:hypothetical protein
MTSPLLTSALLYFFQSTTYYQLDMLAKYIVNF